MSINKMLFILFCCLINIITAQGKAPKVLLVTAHPDDETGAAITIYKITHDLHGIVDLALITNGEGGYKYSTLAEDIYGKELTDEQTGRNFLPTIRKRELMNAGKIAGIRNYYFFDQKDDKYTLEMQHIIQTVWDTVLVKRRLTEIITTEKYDYIFCLLPVPETHAHHRAATIFALHTVADLPVEIRPAVLAYTNGNKNDTTKNSFTELAGFPETRISTSSPVFQLDRTTPFGFKGKLNYKIITNWMIAEHKSQGTMQLYMNGGDIEMFYFFSLNDAQKIEQTTKLFELLKIVPFTEKKYDE